MLGHGAGIGYTGPGPRMGPVDNFSLVTGSLIVRTILRSCVSVAVLNLLRRSTDYKRKGKGRGRVFT